MKRNTMKFAGKTISLALFFVVFLFFGNLTAADLPGCQDNGGCGTSGTDAYNSSPFTAPTYAPSWTTVTTNGRVKGGQYLRFSVVEGEVYSWSTEGPEDEFFGSASSVCSNDSACYTNSDKVAAPNYYGLRCVGGYCLLLFDTELTLLKGESCDASSEFLAYSNSGGFSNQSQIEWKADFTGTVTLLVTNYEYADGSFTGCRHTDSRVESEYGTMTNTTTTVKWQRAASEPCTTCGDKTKYLKDQSSVSASKAPLWTTIQSREAVNLLDFLPTDYSGTTNSPNDLWIKPGSYVVFNVTENQIYRWSTCVADFQDTQLTLFKGDRGSETGDGDSCGEVLAYGDDSKVSYTKKLRDPGTGGVYVQDETNGDILETYCPTGTRQTVLEWQANFTGKVTLLLNEYNCYQCYPQEIVQPGVTYNNWLNCFYEVTGQFKTDADSNFIMDNGWPVEASSSDSNKMPGTFVYPFPLDWQRYDCDTCTGSAAASKSDEGTGFEGSVALGEGAYVEFTLTRGSKYLFETVDPDAVITIRKGASCTGELVGQATGKITYFAESEYDNSTRKYKSDIISVFVSKADCRNGSNTLKYSYYDGSNGNIKSRYNTSQIGTDIVVEDTKTGLQFVDLGSWTTTWKEAMRLCSTKTVGGGDNEEDILACPPPICKQSPAGKYSDSNAQNSTYFCKYQSAAGSSCPAPSCDASYSEFQKTGSNQNDPDLQDFFGKCYYSGSNCDRQSEEKQNANCFFSLHCDDDGGTYYFGTINKCCKCDDPEYTLKITSGTSTVPKEVKCVKNGCDETTNQQCITIGGGCSYIATECPDGYDEDPDTGMCMDNDNREIINANPASSSYSANVDNNSYSIQTPGATDPCPDDPVETHYDNDLGKCQYNGCGTYTNYSNIASGSTSNTGYNGYYLKDTAKCYLAEADAQADSGTAVTCCCESNIEYRGSKSGTLWYGYYNGRNYTVTVRAGTRYIAYTCIQPDSGPCDDYPGAAYNPEYEQCAYCSDPAPVPYELRAGLWGCRPDCEKYVEVTAGDTVLQKCLSCNSDDETLMQDGSGNWKCVKCADGRTPAWVSGSFKCVKECDTSDGSHIIKDGYCYPASYADQCKDGWIEVSGKCRRWQLDSGGDEVYVKCGSYNGTIIDFKNNHAGRTCDPDKPNSYDCDCFKDRCEDSTKADDAKVCPQPYRVCIAEDGRGNCRRYANYTTSTEYTTETLPDGTSVQVVKTCRFEDASGQVCGEAMGGWILPNINQLYSIVDFDLYDAATTYPFSSNGYNRTESDATCEPVADPVADVPCTTNEECEEENEDWFCFRNKCKSSDPYGDNQCGGNNYLCIDNKCVRNNWYWSSTTVVRENTSDARYVWAVNMQDGRSYFAKKGCDGDECSEEVDLNARAHHVLCVKGSSLAGIFDADAPTLDQTFSGWVCDKEDVNKILSVYFGIVDKNGKDVVNLKYSSESDYVKTIPGHDQKGVFYGLTDDSLITDDKSSEIYYNCGFEESVGKAHAFGIQWRTDHVTSGKDEIAAVIKGIQGIECSSARIQDESDAKEDCAYPPYFVTAYGVDGESSTATAVPISPENRPFVFTNRCGDDSKTNDGSYAEECESDEFAETCVYGNDECQLCAATNMNVNGTAVKACTKYNANPERCMDGTLQSQYCVENEFGDFVVAEGHEGEGLECDFYNFAAHNIESSTEECDCPGGTFYLYPETGVFNCNTALSQKVCPDYYVVPDGQTYDKNAAAAACYICDGCKKKRVLKPRCGDGKIHRPNCNGYTNCEVVATASEECDDGNTSNTDSCTNDCKVGTCGDGHIQASLNEICDSGEKNGWYETNCEGTTACPGCASTTCGKPDGSGNATDPFGPRCGDRIVQNRNECSTKYEELGFSSVADCQLKLTGAEEVCDNGVDSLGKSLNGIPVPFSNFLATSAGSDCAEILDGVSYSVSAIHPKFLECVYKYKQFLADPANSGCASDCKSTTAPFCGDGKKDAGEVCDDGLPVVGYNNGVYTLSSAYDDDGLNYNGKKLGSCRLDCMGKYECQNNIVETETCVDATADGFCPRVGEEDGKKLYVRSGDETCDDGALTGRYGYCDLGCKVKAYCGSGADINDPTTLNCIREDSNGRCLEKEECDFGEDGDNPNKSIDLAYSKLEFGTCVAENSNCTRGVENWKDDEGKDIICCKFGRFCGDGTVDNGSAVGDNINWKDASKWQKVNGTEGGANVKYDARNLSLRFELTAATATMELNADIPIDLGMRYLLEFNMMSLEVGGETVDFQGGVNQYDASGALLTTTENHQNKSPYFFTEVLATADGWNRGKNVSPIEGESIGGSNTWYTGTKKVRIVFKMQGAAGTQFLVRALTFYDINHAQYSNSLVAIGGEMCDPGKGNFVTSSNSYMTDCNSDCEWINYCGDGKIQRSNCGTEGEDYFLLRDDQTSCVGGIAFAEEVCDITNNLPDVYNGCEPGCQERGPHCGDGKVDRKTCPTGSEEWCHSPSGNFTDETCDAGPANTNASLSGLISKLSDYNACREDCRPARCGDGILDTVVVDDGTLEGTLAEECDCGARGAYFEDTKGQYTMVNGEKKFLCMNDDGTPLYNTVSAERAALCRPNCKISRCGDGIKDKGEECDDGNFNDHDSCTSQCKFNVIGDGIWAHSRSYLCEELMGLNEAQMKKMRDRGVVDCIDSGSTMTCAQLAEKLTSYAKIKTYFESNVLHCCYNQKLGGTASDDDHNCEYLDSDGNQYKPRDLAVRRCTQYALYPSGEHNTVENHRTAAECGNLVDNVGNVDPDGQYSAIEQCERCVDAKCGKPSNKANQQELNCSTKYTTQTEIEACIERNKYCSKLTGWNITGKCGDGKVDKDAGEKCDNSTNNENFFDDLYGVRRPTPGEYDGKETPWNGSFDSGSRWYNGHYCTGACVGSCTATSPMCGAIVSGAPVANNCWQEGCTTALHGSSEYTESQCGDGNVDTYAGEECDYGSSANFNDWMQSYCGLNCKFNRQYSGGPTAKCGDGQVQGMTGEICDDGNDEDGDYCVGDGSTDSNGYVNHCRIYYGSCGDGKITGPGYTFDSLWNDGTLNTLGGSAGPEDCDTQDERTKTLVAAGLNVNNLCATVNSKPCKRKGSCGDGQINQRFESCDNGGNNLTENVTLNGKTCFAGCKSNPKGGFIKASNAELKGWACDPDHPMTHPDTLVRIEIYDSLYESCKTSHPSDYATACADHYVGVKTIATTIDITVSGVNVIKECGGGSKHGWTYDPSKSDAAMNWTDKTPPYTVEVYATSLDGAPETEVLLGKKTFISAMKCGDGVPSSCSSIEVTKLGETEPSSWKHNQICCDEDEADCPDGGVKIQGACADKGLENKKACINEQCDNGNNNGDDKDCNSKCQSTSCGDGIVQANSSRAEECEGSQTKECGCDGDDCFPPRLQQQGTISGTATCSGTSEPACKWVKTTCQISSTCPPLSTAIKSSWDYGTSHYDPDKASTYISYNSETSYTRYWNGTNWGDPETEVTYMTGTCTFKCNENFTWEIDVNGNKRCKPQNKTKKCGNCPDSAGQYAVWTGTTDKCNGVGGTAANRTITQTVTLDSNGNITYSPSDSDLSTKYHVATDTTEKCRWSCDTANSVYMNNTCKPMAGSHTCSDKPTGTVWIKVTLDGENIKYENVGENMTVPQTLDTTDGSGTYGQYVPTTAQLVALDVNNAGANSPANLKNGGKLKASDPVRCFYGCEEGKYYDSDTGRCETVSCGDGKIFHETCQGVDTGATCKITAGADELCDDGSGNGTHWKGSAAQTKSHCDRYCGSYTRCMSENNNDASKCAFIKASGYNGRIKNGAEYFCGDGKVQVKSSGNGCTGDHKLNCRPVNDNYANMGVSDLNTVSEQCDPNDTASSDRTAMCNKALNLNKADGSYYPKTGSTAPSCGGNCTISNATKDTGCNYCGDGTKADSEACEPGESTSTICSRETGSYYGQTQTYIWNFESSSWPTSWLTASVSSWGLNSTYKYSGSYSYCSTNAGSDSSSATMTLNVTAKAAGNVTFYIYGTSEKNYDYLTIYQGGSQVWTSKGADYDSWTPLSFSVSAGTTAFQFTYSKDSSVSSGIDRYCVDYLSAPSVSVPNTSQTSNPSNKTCNSNCTLSSGTCYSGWCGDGTKNGPEACDSGSSNSDSYGYHCNSNCTAMAPYCGDGVVNGSEPCEVGQTKTVKGDKCDSSWGTSYYYKTEYTCNSSCQWYVSKATWCDN